MIEKSIRLVKLRKSLSGSVNDELMWFGRSLGLFSSRDKNKSCYRIFVELLESERGLTSDELAFKLRITRATVVHHLKRLLGSGLVIKESNRYLLRVVRLSDLVDELRSDLNHILTDLKKSAERIDKELNLNESSNEQGNPNK